MELSLKWSCHDWVCCSLHKLSTESINQSSTTFTLKLRLKLWNFSLVYYNTTLWFQFSIGWTLKRNNKKIKIYCCFPCSFGVENKQLIQLFLVLHSHYKMDSGKKESRTIAAKHSIKLRKKEPYGWLITSCFFQQSISKWRWKNKRPWYSWIPICRYICQQICKNVVQSNVTWADSISLYVFSRVFTSILEYLAVTSWQHSSWPLQCKSFFTSD